MVKIQKKEEKKTTNYKTIFFVFIYLSLIYLVSYFLIIYVKYCFVFVNVLKCVVVFVILFSLVVFVPLTSCCCWCCWTSYCFNYSLMIFRLFEIYFTTNLLLLCILQEHRLQLIMFQHLFNCDCNIFLSIIILVSDDNKNKKESLRNPQWFFFSNCRSSEIRQCNHIPTKASRLQ